MAQLVVHLFGGYRVELDGEPVDGFRTDKTRALLAFLVVEAGRPHRREALAALLWPDRPEAAARASLRQALSRLRHALHDANHAPPFLFVTPTDVQFNTASDYATDVTELEAFARLPAWRRQLLPVALCADFLAGFAVSGSETFQAWVLSKQEFYHRLALDILDDQNAAFEASGEYEQAAAAARLQLQLEPWLEDAHRRCMRALALAGRRDEALHQYEACRHILRAELDIEPAPSTRAMYDHIRAGELVTVAPPPQPAAPLRDTPAVPAGPAAQPLRLVARQGELGQLGRHLEAALAGETQVAFAAGDPGSGKTVLLEAFAAAAMARHPDLLIAGARCSPGGGADPLAALRKLAEMLFGDPGSDATWRLAGREQIDRLLSATDLALTALAEHGPSLVDTLVHTASIAARGALPASRAGSAAQPAWQTALRSRPRGTVQPVGQAVLFDQLICTLAAIAREQPMLLLFDDLQWVDEATAAFLLRLGRELSDSRLLVLGAYRSTTVALGRRDTRSGEITRHPLAATINELRSLKGEILIDLDRADGRAFVEAYVDSEANRLGAPFRDALVAQTGGHALFTVETLRNLQERGELFQDAAGRWTAHEPLDWGALPVRVEAAIAERIERLPEAARRILACASVQGDDFSGELVAEITGAPAGEVITCLSGSLARQHRLVLPQGLQRLDGEQRSIYRFTHHLFQRYIYDQLDPIERAQWHGSVAAALEGQAGGDPAAREQLGARLAWHYESAGLPLRAARALHDAGRQAMRVSAYRAALDMFDQGLDLVKDEPPSTERTEVQGLLEVARLGPKRNLEGVASAGLQDAVVRATEAWAGTPEGAAQRRSALMILWGEAEHLFGTGQLEECLAVTARICDQAVQWGDEDFIALAHWRFGTAHAVMGNPQEAQSHLDWVLDWKTPEQRAALRAVVGLDLTSTTLAFSAVNHCHMGYGERALAHSARATAAAASQGDTYGQVFAAGLGGIVHFLLGSDAAALEACAEQCERLCPQQGFAYWRVYAEMFRGRLMVTAGEDLAGIERMRRVVAGMQSKGSPVGTDSFVVMLADSCLLAARRRPPPGDEQRDNVLATGLAAIDAMLAPSKTPYEQSYEAELRRLRGELLLERDGLAAAGEALACFERAMARGREKGALAWELRAAMSLARLAARRGDAHAVEQAAAQAGLRSVVARFPEGFSFPDRVEAAALMGV